MNDTHGVTGKGWYGFDLDGTLAVYDKWEGIDHIGEPVKPMVDLIKRMHAEGKVVKILTARVSPRPESEVKPNPYPAIGGGYCVPAYADEYHAKALAEDGVVCESALVFYKKAEWNARDFISDWCLKNLGFLPEITHEKDHLMLELYDDRVKQVVPNTGILVEDMVGPRIEIHPVEIRQRRLGALVMILAGVGIASIITFALRLVEVIV